MSNTQENIAVEKQQVQDKVVKKQSSFSHHVIYVCLLALALYIPLCVMMLFIDDRESNFYHAKQSVTESWAGDFTIEAPYIIVKRDQQFNNTWEQRNTYLAPKNLDTKIDLQTQVRQKGPYDISLFTANVLQTGSFEILNKSYQDLKNTELVNYQYQNPYIAINIDHNKKGLIGIKSFSINNVEYKDDVIYDDLNNTILITKIKNPDFNKEINFKIEYTIRGDSNIYLKAVAKNATTHITSDALTPTFDGSLLPATREIKEEGFSATYETTYLNNALYQAYFHDRYDLPSYYAVVSLVQHDIEYASLTRIVKYSFLFIGLSLLVIVSFEYTMKIRIFAIHYLVIAAALILFYTVVLSLMEYIPFILSYVIATLLMSIMMSLYIKSLFNSKKLGLILFIAMLALYTILISLVRLENYALLIGTALLVIILGFVMYGTRKLVDDLK